jgi:hypothetical protein
VALHGATFFCAYSFFRFARLLYCNPNELTPFFSTSLLPFGEFARVLGSSLLTFTNKQKLSFRNVKYYFIYKDL